MPDEVRSGLQEQLRLTTEADGTFALDLPAQMPLGVLMAKRPGYAPDWGSLDRRLGEWRRQMGYDGQAWPHELRFDLQLQSEGRISGQVVEVESAGPALGASVEIFDMEGVRRISAGDRMLVSGEPLAAASVDRQGRYQFSQLPPGYYALVPGSGRQAYAVGTARTRRVRLEAGQYLSEIDFSLERGGTLAVRVVDEKNVPIRNAICAVLPDATLLMPRNIETQAFGITRYGQDRGDAEAPSLYALEVFQPLEATGSTYVINRQPPLLSTELDLQSGRQAISVELPDH